MKTERITYCDVKEGDYLRVTDDWFTCMCIGDIKRVKTQNGEPYIPCIYGKVEQEHLLLGQIGIDGYLVGLEKVIMEIK